MNVVPRVYLHYFLLLFLCTGHAINYLLFRIISEIFIY
jgi:hypothetical protein